MVNLPVLCGMEHFDGDGRLAQWNRLKFPQNVAGSIFKKKFRYLLLKPTPTGGGAEALGAGETEDSLLRQAKLNGAMWPRIGARLKIPAEPGKPGETKVGVIVEGKWRLLPCNRREQIPLQVKG